MLIVSNAGGGNGITSLCMLPPSPKYFKEYNINLEEHCRCSQCPEECLQCSQLIKTPGGTVLSDLNQYYCDYESFVEPEQREAASSSTNGQAIKALPPPQA